MEKLRDRLPGNQATLGAWQQAVRKSGADTAAIQVDDPAALTAGEDDTPAEGVAAVAVDQAGVEQQIERIAQGSEMVPQVSAGRIADAEFFDEGGIVQSTVFQISGRFRMAVELKLIEGSCLLHQLGSGSGRQFLFEMRHTLAEWQIRGRVGQSGSGRRRGHTRGSRTGSCGH